MSMIPEVCLGSKSKQITMPVLGMGTSPYPPLEPEKIKEALLEAIRAGYRHFDTAFSYRSEQPLGEAILEALRLGLIKSRDELFITTKLWCHFTERHLVVPAIKMSLKNLQLDYVDMYMIHIPMKLSPEVRQLPIPEEHISPIDLKSVWEGMEECQNLGLTKAIGVSNFSVKKLEELLSFATIPPAANQVEMNVLWQQKEIRDFCEAKGVHFTAYSPLGANGTAWGDNRILNCDVLKEIAMAKGKTTAQVALRWVYEQGVSVVMKTYNKERMRENLQLFDWSLTQEDLSNISLLPQRKGFTFASMFGPHPLVLEIDSEI